MTENEARRVSQFEKNVEIYHSLVSAVSKAGGNSRAFFIDELKHMSAIQLLDMLAPNNIRFTYEEQ